jgi:hypothetical protein
MEYPFKPKSNRFLIPGQFWGIHLENGKFACGRVIEIEPGSRTGFLAGLMDWIGDEPPTAEKLNGCKTLVQGNVHIKTIHETALDGCISGHRPLDLDGIKSDFFTTQLMWDENCMLMKGYTELRQATEQEAKILPRLGAWGYSMIKCYAEELLVGNK